MAQISSNAGVLLLREPERQVGIITSMLDCIADNRRQYSVEHSIKELVTRRVFQIACGDEGAEDCNALRVDPVLMLLHVYEGLSGKLITTVLRPGKSPDGKETLSYLKRIVTRFRQNWKETIILFRADGHYSSPEVFDWICDQDKVYSVIGLSANEVLKRAIEPIVRELRQCHK